ncbi:MAG: hypothetical protein RBT67_02730 [Thauera sp.]|nr:hypothetical protein [Thauera sp.]
MNVTVLALAVSLITLALTHGAAWFAGRGSLDNKRLSDALAYAEVLVEQQDKADVFAAALERERAGRAAQNKTITREVIRYVELPPERRCDLDGAWRLLHDAAATGTPAETADVAAGQAEPVTDAAALDTVANNYEQCREYIAQIEGWQRWYETVK